MPPDPVSENFLESACPSIQFRMQVEVLGESRTSKPMVRLQGQILKDALVQSVLAWQQPDGWLAWNFHGTKSTEAGIRILCEKGVDPSHPVMANALDALERFSGRLDRGLGKIGKVLDEQGFGGGETMRAAVFAYAGMQQKPFVQEQIVIALDAFRSLLSVDRLDDLTEFLRDKRVFKPGVRWPCLYHLRLLAYTHSWRTPQNREMLRAAVQRLVALSPIPDIHVRSGSQIISPASFCMQDFNPDMQTLTPAQWMMWFHRMECLARLGVVSDVPELTRQLNHLAGLLDKGSFTTRLSHPYFMHWGAYTGLMLEQDWRIHQRRVNDLSFRCALIFHHATNGLPARIDY